LKIILDLHAVPGSQNGFEHSGSRDGSQEWGKSDETIQQTVGVIEFLTARLSILCSDCDILLPILQARSVVRSIIYIG